MPLSQPLNHERVDVTIGFDEERLVRVGIDTEVLVLPQQVPVFLRIAPCAVIRDPMERTHHQVHLPPSIEHDARGAQLGVDRPAQIRVAGGQADRSIPVGKIVDGRIGPGRRWVHQELYADKIRRPDIGLNVEVRPTVGRQTDQLGIVRDALHKQIRPAGALAPVGQKRTSDAGVEHDEALVPSPQVQLRGTPAQTSPLLFAGQDFTVGT